jgi:fructose-1,6-bisphosphatase-3
MEEELNVASTKDILERTNTRIRVRDTDLGRSIERQIADLQVLLAACGAGLIQEG